MSDSASVRLIGVDNPIADPSYDVLGRREVAKSFAENILRLDTSQGAVVGVFGPWGSGKTSFLELVKHEFEKGSVHILDFNPWMFSGVEQLVQRFFLELSSQIKGTKYTDLRKTGTALKDYGDALRSVPNTIKWLAAAIVLWVIGLTGPTGELFGTSILSTIHLVVFFSVGTLGLVSVVLKMLGVSLIRRQRSIYESRKKVEIALCKSKKRIIVILDDVDRLAPEEIRDVFKLVRLTASFPKLVYIVACDHNQVARALGKFEKEGTRYLEKIIQMPFNLPEIPAHKLEEQTRSEIEEALSHFDQSNLDREVIESILQGILRPLIRNMRDVRRYTVAIREAIESLHGTIALADVLGLEAIRVFLRDVFNRLPAVVDVLTEEPTSDVIAEGGGIDLLRTGRARTTAVDQLIEVADEHKEVVETLFRVLFPRVHSADGEPQFRYETERFCHESRVACKPILRLYLERFKGGELLAHGDAQRALRCMHDLSSLKNLFQEISPTMWRHVLAHLSGFSPEQFAKEDIDSALVVFWSLLDDRSLDEDDNRSLFKVIQRTTLRLSNVYRGDSKGRDVMLIRVMSKLGTLTTKVRFVGLVARNDEQFRIVSQMSARQLKRSLRTQIGSACVDVLLKERDLTVIFESAHDLLEGLPPIVMPNDPALTFALILHANHIWDRLERLFGGRDTLVEKIRDLVSRRDEVTQRIERQGISHEEVSHEFRLLKEWLKRSAIGADRTDR